MKQLSGNFINSIKAIIIIYLTISTIITISTLHKWMNITDEKLQKIIDKQLKETEYTVEDVKENISMLKVILMLELIFQLLFLFYLIFMNKIGRDNKELLNKIIKYVLIFMLLVSILKLIFSNAGLFLNIIIYSYILFFIKYL